MKYRYEFDADMLGGPCDLNAFEDHLQREFDAAGLPLKARAHTSTANGAAKLSDDAGVSTEDIDAAWDKAVTTFFAA